MRGAGRPYKLTPEVHGRICRLITAGVCPEPAAAVCGVARSTLRQWLSRGREKHPTRRSTPELVAFATDVDIAIARSEVALVLLLREFVDGARPMVLEQLRAVWWLLARRWPSRWAVRGTRETAPASSTETARPTIQITHADPDGDRALVRHPCPEELGADSVAVSAGRRR